MENLISTLEAARLLGRSPRRIRQMVDEGKIIGEVRGRDLWIDKGSVLRFKTERDKRLGDQAGK